MSQETGKLEAIWVKRFKGGPMDPQQEAGLVAGRGIEGNANQGGTRQVTILSKETWESLAKGLEQPVDPSARRANLMVSGVELKHCRGRVLQIGNVRFRLNGETRPCEQMEAAQPGLKQALSADWNGGAFGEVLDDGMLRVGDAVVWGPDETDG